MEIKKLKLNLKYTDVKANIDGIIGKEFIDVGNMVGSNQLNTKLATIVNSDKLYINFSPSDEEASFIRKYKSTKHPKVEVYLPSDKDTIYDGTLDFIDNKTDESTSSVNMRATISNPNNTLLAGSFVKVRVFVSDKLPIYVLSIKNIMDNQMGSFVYVVDENNKIKQKHIKIVKYYEIDE